MALGVAVDEDDRHGGVAAPLERVLAALVRIELRRQPGPQVLAELDHGCSTGKPLRSHSGTPPSTTWSTSATPCALQQARGDRGALARGADDRDRPLAVERRRGLAQVVVGREGRAGDVARVPLVALADVEDLSVAPLRARAASAT